jgi:prepilin-type N-terminal cleavage/methylation domain-containing protein
MASGGRQEGFSLIEVLVVMLILGVLAVIALNSMSSGGGTANRSFVAAGERQACEASASTIETAALAYYVANGATWPPDIAAMVTSTPAYLRSEPKARWGLVYDNTTGQVDAAGCNKL